MQSTLAPLFPAGPRAAGHVLVAGGRSEERMLIRDVLTADGHHVTLVRTTEDAIRRLTEEPDKYELVVLHAHDPAERETLAEVASCAPTVLVADRRFAAMLEHGTVGLAGVVPEPYELDDLRVLVTTFVERAARRRGN